MQTYKEGRRGNSKGSSSRLKHNHAAPAHNVLVTPQVAEEFQLSENALSVHEVSKDILDALDCDTTLCHRVIRRDNLTVRPSANELWRSQDVGAGAPATPRLLHTFKFV